MSEVRRIIRPDGTRVLALRDKPTPESIHALEEGGFDLLWFGGGNWSDFEFLAPYRDTIRRVEIAGPVDGVKGLDKLTGLVELELNEAPGAPLDLMAFQQLEVCYLRWQKRYPAEFFTLPKLRKLTLSYYTGTDCRDIAQARGLDRLDLRMGSMHNLAGLEALPDLKDLSLGYLRKLEDISAAASCSTLTRLHIEKCPHSFDLAFVQGLTELRELFLDCGSPGFADIDWMAKMTGLVDVLIAVPVQSINWEVVFALGELVRVVIDTHPGYQITDEELFALAAAHGRVLDNYNRAGTKKHPAFKFWMNRKA